MNTKKEDLRPIEVKKGSFSKITINGFFHTWFKKVGENGDEYVWAIIEDDNGIISETHAETIKFMDRK